MIIKIGKGDDESFEEFDKVVDQIIRDIVVMRGMPLENGDFMRTSIQEIERSQFSAIIDIGVQKVKCRRLDDF